jgi:hypothetical protein
MDAVGLTLVGTFVFMMVASVFALSFSAPPTREKLHRDVRSTVIG